MSPLPGGRCDPIWHVSSRSGDGRLACKTAIPFFIMLYMIMLAFLPFHLAVINSDKEVVFYPVFVHLSLCLLVTLHENYRSHLHQNFNTDKDKSLLNYRSCSNPDFRYGPDSPLRVLSAHVTELRILSSVDWAVALHLGTVDNRN